MDVLFNFLKNNHFCKGHPSFQADSSLDTMDEKAHEEEDGSKNKVSLKKIVKGLSGLHRTTFFIDQIHLFLLETPGFQQPRFKR